MNTLQEPIYEIHKETQVYKEREQFRKDKNTINKLLKRLANDLAVPVEEIHYYKSGRFGILGNTKWHKKYHSELMKNADRNDIYLFKKTSEIATRNKKLMDEITQFHGQITPFLLHDLIGSNNFDGVQWVRDRLFVGVRDEKDIPNASLAHLTKVDYHDYLDALSSAYKETSHA